ncbi:MAG: VacB/RNase II family 3'-5' exoribonuclease [Deltaproteobacteria bacterium]|nr:VacB/RNase II family 3'-5' exoribonuclease [Deltaproteobacteria bacterium]
MRRVSRDEVLAALTSLGGAHADHPRVPGKRALHVAELCALLDLDTSRMGDVERVLDELGDLGLARAMPGRRWRPTAAALTPEEKTAGVITVNPRGFGFVTAEDGEGDVFVGAASLAGAIHGDRVEIRVRPSDRGREGTVTSVLARGITRVPGVLRRKTKSAWVEPDDARVRAPLVVRGEMPPGARDGVAVVAKIERYPRHPDELCEVVVLEALGTPGDPDVEVRKILLRENVEETFPADCDEEARERSAPVDARDRAGRVDWRALPIATIDPFDARDHDDAVYAEPIATGGWRVIVAIADVSHYVPEGSAIDREALLRGTSIYLPDRAIPMLPRALSSGICSLVDGEDRLVLGLEVELAPDGTAGKHRFVEAVIRSAASLTYEQIAGLLHPASGFDPGPARAMSDSLRHVIDASHARRRLRMRRGSLDFDLPEAKVVLGDDGKTARDIVKTKKHPAVREAYGVVEDLMLLANEVVGAHLASLGVPAVFRVHPPPDEDRITAFADIAHAFGHELDVAEAQSPATLARFLHRIEGSPQGRTLGYLLLRAMKQASYDTVNIGHFGLAAGTYLHFTSPIRRYPDLTVHRTLRAAIRGDAIDVPATTAKLRLAAAESSRLERRATDLEREVVALHRALLMRGRIGDTFAARVVGLGPMGAFVEIEEPFVEALVRTENLGGDVFELDELGVRLCGKRTGRTVTLGDPMRVRVIDVSVERRQIEAVPDVSADVDDDAHPARRPRSAAGSDAPRRRPKTSTHGTKARPKEPPHRGGRTATRTKKQKKKGR